VVYNILVHSLGHPPPPTVLGLRYPFKFNYLNLSGSKASATAPQALYVNNFFFLISRAFPGGLDVFSQLFSSSSLVPSPLYRFLFWSYIGSIGFFAFMICPTDFLCIWIPQLLRRRFFPFPHLGAWCPLPLKPLLLFWKSGHSFCPKPPKLDRGIFFFQLARPSFLTLFLDPKTL